MTNYQTKILESNSATVLQIDVNRFLKGYDCNNIKEVKFHLGHDPL